MKLRVTFKTPDAVYHAREAAVEELRDQIDEVAEKFIAQGEYLTVELDLEAGTCTVVEQ